LRRCLYPGLDGMRRWVGLGVIADNFIQMGCYLARQRWDEKVDPRSRMALSYR